MEEHLILPKTPEETKLVADRILALSRTVVTPADWLNLLSAAESVLPRNKGKVPLPSEIDLVALASEPHMMLLATILRAVGSSETYRANRRYRLRDWLRIVVKFANLSMYVVPPAQLNYSVDLCMATLGAKEQMDSIVLLNALTVVDIRVVRQQVPSGKIDGWSTFLVEYLREKCEFGEEIQAANNERESFEPDQYEEWSDGAKTLERIAREFYQWTGRDEPEMLPKLRRLIESVDRPEDPETDDDEDRGLRHTSGPTSYWTLERMFEDL